MALFVENFYMDNIWEEIPAIHGRAQVPLHIEVTRMEVVAEEEEEEEKEEEEEEAVEQSEDKSIDESDYVFDYEFDYESET